jgi:hypothetical protein
VLQLGNSSIWISILLGNIDLTTPIHQATLILVHTINCCYQEREKTKKTLFYWTQWTAIVQCEIQKTRTQSRNLLNPSVSQPILFIPICILLYNYTLKYYPLHLSIFPNHCPRWGFRSSHTPIWVFGICSYVPVLLQIIHEFARTNS